MRRRSAKRPMPMPTHIPTSFETPLLDEEAFVFVGDEVGEVVLVGFVEF